MVVGLAASQAYDRMDASSGVRLPGRVDGAAGALLGVEGRRAAGAALGDRGAATPAPEAEVGLGRPGGDRSPGPAAAQVSGLGRLVTPDTLLRWHWTHPR